MSMQKELTVFTQLFPILSTRDIGRALRFYRDLLGATVTYEFAGPDGAPAYVGLQLGSSEFGIGHDPTAAVPSNRPPITLWVYAEDCDAAIERLRAGGVRIVEEPADQPWGERVARVRDEDGNLIIVGSTAKDSSA